MNDALARGAVDAPEAVVIFKITREALTWFIKSYNEGNCRNESGDRVQILIDEYAAGLVTLNARIENDE